MLVTVGPLLGAGVAIADLPVDMPQGGVAGAGGVTAGDLQTTATDIDQLLGWSLCAGGSGEASVSVSVEACGALVDRSGPFTGVTTLYGGAGFGVGAEGHVYMTHTWQLWSIPNPLGGLLPLIGGNLP